MTELQSPTQKFSFDLSLHTNSSAPATPMATPVAYSFAMQSIVALEAENLRLKAEAKTQSLAAESEKKRLAAENEARLASLEKRNMELERENVKLKATPVEERKSRWKPVTLPPAAHSYLKPILKNKTANRYVFESESEEGKVGRRKKGVEITEDTSRPIDRHVPLRLLKDECKRLKFPNLGMIGTQSLRKAFAKRLYENCKTDAELAAKLSGHRDGDAFLRFIADVNPQPEGIPEGKKKGKTKRDLTPEEITKLVEQGWETSRNRDRNRALIVVMALTGTQVNKCLNWKVGDLLNEDGEFQTHVAVAVKFRKKRQRKDDNSDETEEETPKRVKKDED